MAGLYELRRYGTVTFIIVSVVVVALSLYVSGSIVKDLAEQERDRMQIWADATKELVNSDASDTSGASTSYFDFLLSIIARNRTIPVLLTDDDNNILLHRNFDLPDAADTLAPWNITPADSAFLYHRLARLQHSENVIHINISPDKVQHLYYEDSKLLRRLSLYPYVQLAVMLVFVAVVYFAVTTSKRSEQNKVWVGLSKETAHQLGTPISSLMAWTEILPEMGVDPDTVSEMNKDVQRLSSIAQRFGKIGSKPQLQSESLNEVVGASVGYMSGRISSRIDLSFHPAPQNPDVRMSASLFGWVMENLIKNAVDAMEGHGSIAVTTGCDSRGTFIEVADTGKGLPRKNFKTVFNPGYTTKSRGWGLGLTLAKRIIEQYHRGRIFVKTSEPGVGTTFRIELPA